MRREASCCGLRHCCCIVAVAAHWLELAAARRMVEPSPAAACAVAARLLPLHWRSLSSAFCGRLSECRSLLAECRCSHLSEADIVGILAEASSADIEVILADEAVSGLAHAAAQRHNNDTKRAISLALAARSPSCQSRPGWRASPAVRTTIASPVRTCAGALSRLLGRP